MNNENRRNPENISPPTILIVEDEKLTGWSVGKILQNAGFHVAIVDSTKEALKLIGSQTFSLVLTDLNVPHSGGDKIAEAVKKKDTSTMVVMMSSLILSTSEKKKYGEMVDTFIEKPVDFDELLDLVKYLQGAKVGCGK